MRLATGSQAPTFSQADLSGAVVDVAALTADKPLWLAFFRFASCPLCNLRVHQFLAQWPRFADRCTFVAVFQSPAERLQDFISTHAPPFAVLADPTRALFRQYGVESSLVAALHPQVIRATVEAKTAGFPIGALSPKDGAALRVPADFIVAPGGRIHLAHYGSHVADSVDFDVADGALTSLGV